MNRFAVLFAVVVAVLATLSVAQVPPVKVDLYYESLCPYCKQFISGSFWTAYKAPGVAAIMNITLYPYGNAKETQTPSGQYQFTCQHGTNECVGNILETCALSLYPDVDVHFPYIHCIESSSSTDFLSIGQSCASQFGIDFSAVQKCMNSPQGNMLEHQMAVATGELDPPHQYVPWIVLNGIHTEKIQDEAENDLLSVVCKLYTGTKPSGCNQAGLRRCARDD